MDLSDQLPESHASNHLGKQILRSGTSPAPNYGEVQGAESQSDFIHKMKVCLKELRETLIWLKICRRRKMLDEEYLTDLIEECHELISIFVSSIQTAENNDR